MRETIKKNFKDLLDSTSNEIDESELKYESNVKVAELIENEIFLFANENSKDRTYRDKGKSLINRLKGDRNIFFRNAIRIGNLSIESFCSMTEQQLDELYKKSNDESSAKPIGKQNRQIPSNKFKPAVIKSTIGNAALFNENEKNEQLEGEGQLKSNEKGNEDSYRQEIPMEKLANITEKHEEPVAKKLIRRSDDPMDQESGGDMVEGNDIGESVTPRQSNLEEQDAMKNEMNLSVCKDAESIYSQQYDTKSITSDANVKTLQNKLNFNIDQIT